MKISNAQKTPLSRTLPQFAQQKALDVIGQLGYALPGSVQSVSGSIVTVKFALEDVALPVVQMPVFGPEYIRYPIQVGDLGVAFPASTSIAATAGLAEAASYLLPPQGNLSALVWFPIGSANFRMTPDPNKVVIYGPKGVIIEDSAAALKIVIDTTGNTITLSIGSEQIQLSSSGVTLGPNTMIDSRVFLNHTHTGGTISGDTGPVI